MLPKLVGHKRCDRLITKENNLADPDRSNTLD